MRYAVANASYKSGDRTEGDRQFDTNSYAGTVGVADTAIGHRGVAQNSIGQAKLASISQISPGQVNPSKDFSQIGTTEIGISQIYSFQTTLGQIAVNQTRTIENSPTQISFRNNRTTEIGIPQIDTSHQISQGRVTQVSTAQIGSIEYGVIQFTPTQIGISQVSPTEVATQIGSTQVNIAQHSSSQAFRAANHNVWEIPFSSSISLQQFLSSHHYNVSDTTVPAWTSFLRGQTPFNLNIEIKDLPTGQLAEASLTGFDSSDRPTSGTLTLDIDGNGLGWFIDSTPWDNTEFSTALTNTAFRATPGSAAFGRYDLLTTILHEMAHLSGFINGYAGFDAHIKTINGTPTFVGNGFTAPLTPDRSHLDPRFYPHDLMNSTLAPGVRKLPSALNLQILESIRNWAGTQGINGAENLTLTAPIASTPLVGIQNGSFDSPTSWDTRGAAQVLSGQAVLREDSPLLTNFSQTFLIPEGAKALQFTLVSSDLDGSNNAPGDAFEAALLNARTLTPIVRSIDGLSHTDAFFNLQHSGSTFAGSGVMVQQNANNTRTVTVDLAGVEPNTLATLYFDLLGFGTREGSVTIDNVRLLTSSELAPVATDDSVTTAQAQPVTLNVLTIDRLTEFAIVC